MADIIGTLNSEFLPGTPNADFILALAGNDTILGLGGNDTINGNENDDIIAGGAGNDYTRGGTNNDSLGGELGNDTLFGDQGDDTVFGGQGTDLINGNQGDDLINGNEGNDIVRGGQGSDYVRGGQGNDQMYGDQGDDTLFGDLGNDTIFGFDGIDLINGNQGNDLINGNEGNDTIRGGQGDDYARGGQGSDQVYGELGNDTLFGDQGDDTVFGGQGTDLINGNEGDDFINGNEGNDTIRGGQANDFVRGGKDNDLLYGELGNDTLFGELGNDTILGGANNDLINGNEGDDILNGNEGNDTVRGGIGNDLVRGGMEDDLLYGDLGSDTLFGDLGNDTVFGGKGTDLLFGNQGDDLMNGNEGSDTLFGGKGSDTVFGGKLTDLLFGNQGDDLMNGNEGNDTLFGGQGNDTVRGGTGNDRIFGDKGNDVLFGDLGADTLTGNAGDTLSDIFVVGRVTGAPTKTTGGPTLANADIITDFQPCVDFISLTGGLAYANLNIFQGTGANSKDTIIQDKGTNEFLTILQGINADSIDGTAFLPAGPPTVRILASDSLAAEPAVNEPQDLGEFTVFVPCAPTKDLVVNYTISGTATNDDDYNSLSGSVTIRAGSNSAIIPVIPIADTEADPNETVTVTLTPTANYNVDNTTADGTPARGSATVTITDSPTTVTKPQVIINAITPNTTEGSGTPGRFQVARTGGDITEALTVNYTVTGTATPGNDYGALSGTITIPAGQSVATFDVSPTDDGTNESTETVVVSIANDSAYTVAAPGSATVRVLDNDALPGNVFRVDDDNQQFPAGPNVFNTIQAAVNAAPAGSFILIAQGTYNENVTIDKSLTVRGPNAGLSPGGGFSVPPAVVRAGGTGLGNPVFTVFTNNPVTIEGLTIEMRGDNGIRGQVSGSNVTIRQNDFTGDGPPNGGTIFLNFSGGGTANVIDNLVRQVTSGLSTSGIQAFQIGTARVTDNVIANLNGPGIVADSLTNGQINNNTVTNTGEQGIQLAGGSADIINNDIADANTSSDPDAGGIRLRDSGLGGPPLGTVNVLSNTITDSFNGIAIRDGSTVPGTVAINLNNFIGNLNAGFYHGGTGTINATNNWWDSATGPTIASNPGGIGQPILGASADQVNFTPFATSPF